MTLLPAINASGAGSHGWAPMNSANLYGGGDGCMCARVHACVYAHVRVCMRDVFAIYDKIFHPG